MLNLVPAIKEIEKQIVEMERGIKPYRDSIEALRNLNEACEECNGTGKVLRHRACAEDDRPDPNNSNDWLSCPKCFGTGRNN